MECHFQSRNSLSFFVHSFVDGLKLELKTKLKQQQIYTICSFVVILVFRGLKQSMFATKQLRKSTPSSAVICVSAHDIYSKYLSISIKICYGLFRT